MKKIQMRFILIITLCFSVNAFAADSLCSKSVAYWDFENITDNAKTYIANASDIVTGTTNNGIKNYDFVYENGNNKLKFTAYNIGEISGNASRYFDFLFKEAYNLQAYPQSKLVTGFNENILQHDNDWNYTHSIIAGNSGNIIQMFTQKNGDYINFRPNNKGLGFTFGKNTELQEKYIIDMQNQVYHVKIGNITANNIAFQNIQETNAAKIRWYPQTGEIYTIDNIYAYIVPNNFNCLRYDGNDGTLIPIDSRVSFDFSSPVEEGELQKISVYCNNALVSSSLYQAAQEVTTASDGTMTNRIYIKWNQPMQYSGTYKVVFPANFTDIAGNTLLQEKQLTYQTYAAPSFQLAMQCKNSSGNTIDNLTDVTDGKLYYQINITNTSGRQTDGYIIAGYYTNDKLVKCAYFKKSFFSFESQSLNGFFYLENTVNSKIKVFASQSLTSGNTFGSAIVFQ